MTVAALRRSFAEPIWRVLLIAAVVLLVRGVAVSRHQSERFDDAYHLNRGVAFLRHAIGNRVLNDPPLGEAFGAVPLVLTHSYNADPTVDMGLYGHRLSPERLLMLVAIWKSLLLLPMVAVVFLWTRELYGLASTWIATALLLIEPTIAAHTPLPSVDVIGVEGIVIACFAIWKYQQRPTIRRALLASAAVALGMMLKNTAMILPGIALLYTGIWWVARPLLTGGFSGMRTAWRGVVGRRAGHAAIAVAALLLCLFAFSLFDVSKPLRKKDQFTGASPTVVRLLRREWPAGTYVRSVAAGVDHMRRGHASFLNGKKRWGGTWRYFPTVATYKLPVGIGAALLIGGASLAWRRPRFEEWSLALPMLVYLATLLNTEINIGFRHFLPVMAFALMFAARAAADGSRQALRVAVMATCCVVAFVETARWHPNYLSFTNALRGPPWLKMSDSNLDWGQSLPALRRWADARTDGRPIRFAWFGWENPIELEHYLDGSRVEVVLKTNYGDAQPAPLPTRGLFVVSPVALAGAYDKADRLRPLRKLKPVEVIDGVLLVYDLDALTEPIRWTRVKTRRSATLPAR